MAYAVPPAIGKMDTTNTTNTASTAVNPQKLVVPFCLPKSC